MAPPDLDGAPLPAAKAKPAAALFDWFPRDSRELVFNGREPGELPSSLGEFTELESLWVRATGIKQVPRSWENSRRSNPST
ncbi:hypothetical protein [Myxococcus stipitatus]|uniref:hypothetical protein n=1 Tax=Myxococcus stipitatus TaxID=83455 RepID=UPI0030CC13C4